MAKSLRDQLVASGIASASRAKKAEKAAKVEAQAQRKRAKQGKPEKPEESLEERLKRAKAAKAKRDKELAASSNSKAAERARRAEIKQLVLQHDQRQKSKDDDVPYNFRHNKKIKRIYVPKTQLDALSSGKLIIINNDGMYSLVTPEIADRVAERDPRWIVSRRDEAPEEEMDDFYKKFEVPDDLDW